MKNLLLISLVLCAFSANAQRGYSSSEYARTEIGVSGGLLFPDKVPTVKLQVPIRVADHIQVAPTVLYFTDGIEDVIGRFVFMANVNFPVSKSRSYFYPGIGAGYFMGVGPIAGAHIGYTLALGDRVGINLQPGVLLASDTKTAGVALVVEMGLRFSLD